MVREEIDYFHAPEISLEVLFAVRSEKISQRRRSVEARSAMAFKNLGVGCVML